MTTHPPYNFSRPAKWPVSLMHQIAAKSINSGIAAIIGTFIIYPMDICKTRLQNQRNFPDNKSIQLYTSLIDCFKKIRKAEGYRGLYRGCAANILLIAPEKTLKLVSNDLMRSYLKTGNHPLSLGREMVAGATAGFSQSILSTPMDLMKINMQDAGRLAALKNSKVRPNSSRKVLRNLLKRDGFLGLFRGFAVTSGRNIFFSVVYFPVFFTITELGPDKNETHNSRWAFVAGCLAGGIAATAATPFDVIKTRTQRLKLAQSDVLYAGPIDAFVKILKSEGPLALMRGAGIRAFTISPLFGIIQFIYYLGIGEYILNQ